MDLYYNEQKVASLPIDKTTTIGGIKKILSDWLVPQGVTNYTVRLFFNNGSELSNLVFQTDTYDAADFKAQADILSGGSIRVTPITAPSPVTAQEPTREELMKHTVPQLKDMLRAAGKKVGGRKAELIDRLLGIAPAPITTTAPAPITTTAPVTTTAPAPITTTAPAPITTTAPAPITTTAPATDEIIYVIPEAEVGFRTREDALQWWVENRDIDPEIGIEEEVDYYDEDIQDMIEENMALLGDHIIEVTVLY